MKRILTALILCLLCVSGQAYAQNKSDKPTPEEWARFRTEVRNYKHDFLARELELTAEQKREFFPVYDEMDDEIERINADTRSLAGRVFADPNASDVAVEAAARAVYGQKKAEGEVEERYFDRFKQILTPRQLLKLRHAERQFTQRLMRHHNKNKARDKK